MENMSICRGKPQKYKPTLSKTPGFRIPRIYNVPVPDIFKRSFFGDRWDGLGGVETGNIINESAAARTRKDPVEFRGQGYDPILPRRAYGKLPRKCRFFEASVGVTALFGAPLGFGL